MTERAANISGILSIVIWFLTPLLIVLTGAMPPFLLGAFAYLVSFALICAWWVGRGESLPEKFRMTPKAYALGTFGIGIYNLLYIYAMKHGPVLEVSLLNYLWPAFLIIFSSLLQKTRPDAFAWAGIVLCFAGSYFVFGSRGVLSFSAGYAVLMMAVLCSVMWAVYSSLIRYVPVGKDQIAVFFLITGLMMLGMHLAFETPAWPSGALAWGMLLAYTLGRVAFPMWNNAMKHGSARLLASLSYFIPLFATLALAAAGLAHFNPSLALGAVLIIGGCLVINFRSIARSAAFVAGRVFA
jgi:drug/metabolite transporter (DMT)-like permease